MSSSANEPRVITYVIPATGDSVSLDRAASQLTFKFAVSPASAYQYKLLDGHAAILDAVLIAASCWSGRPAELLYPGQPPSVLHEPDVRALASDYDVEKMTREIFRLTNERDAWRTIASAATNLLRNHQDPSK